jgi:outer membrane protein assembly factor BamB/tetratricopeptide (TPR) repeat protein
MTSLKGNLNSVDLANIFQMLSLNQREGTLYIFEGASRKAIYFGQDGVSMLSKGRSKSDSLGRILLRFDRLTPEQLTSGLAKRLESGRLLGQVLVEEGVCSRSDVEEALQIQIEEEVYSLFIWKDAQFEFVEGDPDEEFLSEGVQKLTFNVNSLIMEAAKRVDEWEWIQSVISDAQEVYRYTGRNVDLTDSIFQESYSGKVLAAIDGKRSVEEIIEASYVNRFEVCKIAAILLEGGAIEKLPVPDLRREADAAVLAGDTDAAVKFLSRLVAVKGDTPQMHKQLAEAFEGDRELERAAFHYSVYAEIQADQHEHREAFNVYRRICEFLPTDLKAADRMIELFAINPDGLEEHGKDMIARGKQLAEIYVELKRSSRAIQVLHRVVSLGPDDQDLRSQLIQVYLASGMPGEAIAEYEALADTAMAVKDFEGAEKIFRKILSIDRNRTEVATRLNQIVSKKKRRAQNIRNLVIGCALLAAAGVGGWYALDWYKERRAEQAQKEQDSENRLQEVRLKAAPIAQQLDVLLKELATRPADLLPLAAKFKEHRPKVDEVEKLVNAAVKELADLRAQYPGMSVDEEAVTLTNDLGTKLTQVKKRMQETQKTLRENGEAQFEQAQGVVNVEPTRSVLAKLEMAITLTADCDGWLATEKGQACHELHTQIQQYLVKFDTTKGFVEKKIADGEIEEAQKISLEYVIGKDFPPTDLRDEMPYPVRLLSKPPGAHVSTRDGVDTTLVTPCVLVMSIAKGAAFDLDLTGFATAKVDVPAVKVWDGATVAAKTPKSVNVLFEKKVVLRKATSDGRPITATPMATPKYMVMPSSGKTCDVINLQTGKVQSSLAISSASPVKSSGVMLQRPDGGVTVVLATADGVVMFFDAESGRSLGTWSEARGGVTIDLQLSGQDVLVADDRGHLFLLEIATRRKLWDYAALGPSGEAVRFSTEPTVAEGRVFIGCENGTVHVVPLSGPQASAAIIAPPDAGRISAPVTVAQGMAYIVSRNGKESRVMKWPVGGSHADWQSSVPGEIRSAPMVFDSSVYFVSNAGDVAGLKVSTGDQFHSSIVAPSMKLLAPAVMAGDVVYVGCNNGTLYALDPKNAMEPAWKFRVPMSSGNKQPDVTTSCVVTGGLILFGASDTSVYVLEEGK